MTKTDSVTPAAYVTGKHEADALRFMNEWEPSSRVPTAHIVAQQTSTNTFCAFEWSPGRKVWRPWHDIHPNAPRRVMVEALMKQASHANLTIMDEPIDFADYDGFTPAELDHCILCESYTLLCPVGVPGGGDGWALVEVNKHGVGSPLGGLGGGNPNRLGDGPFFHERELAARYRKAALPVEQAPLGYQQPVRVAPVLIRHNHVARQIVPKEGWGIHGRPDLLARQVDRELAINAAAAEEEERQRKSGQWLQPPQHLRFEVATRMQREWAAADALALAS